MMTPIMAMAAMLLEPAIAQASTCPTPVAPDIVAARSIAQAAIDAAPNTDATRYDLIVEPHRDRTGHWIAYQVPSTPVAGGGGLSMRIDRCSGAVRELHRQR